MTDSDIPFHPLRFAAPRYWPMWLGLGVLRALILLPYPWLLRLGAGLGRLMYWFIPARRHIARVNIGLCFPELDRAAQEQLVRESFRSAGIGALEMAMGWWFSPRRLRRLCHIEGLEHIRAAQAQGKGVILLSAHMTSLEIGGRLLALEQPFQVMYKKQRNPLFEAVTTRSRLRTYQRAIQRHDVRGMLKGLKANMVCWYLPDQDFGRRNAVFAPFFGIPTATVIATSRFARISGAAVVPYYPLRRADGSGYDLKILPPLEGFPSDDDVADATRINALIEQWVREAPAQYLWLHRRFRTRPDDEADPYQ